VSIVDVSEPFDLGWYLGQMSEFHGGQEAVFLGGSNEGFRRIHRRILLSIKSIIKSKTNGGAIFRMTLFA